MSYTLHNSDRVFQVSGLGDLNNIIRPGITEGLPNLA